MRFSQTRPCPKRVPRLVRGYSLTELLVVLSASTIILTMSAVLIHRIMHEQSRAQDFQDAERSSLRLSAQFRRDVHRASNVSLQESEASRGLTLHFAKSQANAHRQIEYRFEQGCVTRILSDNGNTAWREEFSFPAETEWTMHEETDPRRLLLVAHNRPQGILAENDQHLEEDQHDNRRPAALWITPVIFRVEACLRRVPGVVLTFESGESSK